MKTIFLILVNILVINSIASSQDSCKVLMPTIAGHYEGGCKKGLAQGDGKATGTDAYEGHFKKGYPDGKGTYTWANGDYYSGTWDKGFRDGSGEMHTKIEKKDTVLSGLWEKDKYMGPKPIMPKVTRNVSVSRYSFTRTGDENQIVIKIYQNGIINTTISNFMANTSSGHETHVGNFVTFKDFDLPFDCKINYTTYNKLHTAQYDVIFEFVITQPGTWEVDLHN